MPSRFYNLSTDTTLGGVSPSDAIAPSQKAIKTYVDSQGGGSSGSFSDYTTDCIVEIPLDINLSVSGTTLTLKSGSKVYIPNGRNTYDTLTIAQDLTKTYSTDGVYFLTVDTTGSELYLSLVSNSSSGSTQPSSTPQIAWYDTSNNNVMKVYDYDGSDYSWINTSLPLAIITISSSTMEITQVFNGFGYIGSIVFALPGVKALQSAGRNTNGMLNNVENTINSVKRIDLSLMAGDMIIYMTRAAGISFWYRSKFYIDTFPASTSPGEYLVYSTRENLFYQSSSTGTYSSYDRLGILGIAHVTSTKVDALNMKTPVQAVTHTEGSWAAHQAMPSDKYVNLTLGASGAAYTAPADGYFMLFGTSTAVAGWCALQNTVTLLTHNPSAVYDSRGVTAFLPAKKGDSVRATYGDFAVTYFRFIYAEGAK